jgi:hypothetical protein
MIYQSNTIEKLSSLEWIKKVGNENLGALEKCNYNSLHCNRIRNLDDLVIICNI